MVRRFTANPNYPNKFQRSTGNDQSSVPSQHSDVPPPFDPSLRPDQIPTPPPQEPILSIVRHVFDSRPPNAFDFYWEDNYQAGVLLNPVYSVPPGFVLFIRRIVISVYPFPTGDNHHDPIMNVYGDSDAAGPGTQSLQILIDSVGTTFWTPNTQGISGVPINDIFTSDIDFDCFILVNSNQTITINIPGLTSLVAALGYNVYAHYYGNLIFSTGRSLNAEVGNFDPSLVTTNVNLMG